MGMKKTIVLKYRNLYLIEREWTLVPFYPEVYYYYAFSGSAKPRRKYIMESNKRVCKTCLQLKDRISAGKFPNGRDKKWVGQDGLLWNGASCGKCNQNRAKLVMKKVRSNEV
jgi:hypothetical protein